MKRICRIQLQKKKSGVKKCLEILPLRGEGGVGPLMANAILNFHFDFLNPSLMWAMVLGHNLCITFHWNL